ncbi:hypothetical protein M514_09658 [Trichuris suis]|uniref:Uncharacterized protein n=1 Tax=Trichuris suis TaxID=68888 RepID=A0A085NJU4_9BILA|nr:hypothetical protein M513_09658 [Trichuris suis]KFD69740.1 hypothetical protein M514_09658 [Trichuris suis]
MEGSRRLQARAWWFSSKKEKRLPCCFNVFARCRGDDEKAEQSTSGWRFLHEGYPDWLVDDWSCVQQGPHTLMDDEVKIREQSARVR